MKILKCFLSTLNSSFSIICFSETWLNDLNVYDLNYELPNYISAHQITSQYKEGEVSVYIHKNVLASMIFSINCRDIESLYVELLHEKRRNTLMLSIDHPTAK